MNKEMNKRTPIKHKYLTHRFGEKKHLKQHASISELFLLKEQTLPRLFMGQTSQGELSRVSLFRIFW